MSVPQTIRELVERFERQFDAYRSPQYNETRRKLRSSTKSLLLTRRIDRLVYDLYRLTEAEIKIVGGG